MAVGLTDTLSRCRSRAGGIHSAQWPGVLLDHLACLNATQAAIRAGYSEKTAEQQGYQLLQKTSVQERISNLKSMRNEQVSIDAAYVLRRLTEIDQMDVADILLANTEVIAREKIYLTSLREPGTWPTVLYCKSVSYRVSSTAASR
ncbi:terminase small subunit [Edwardsiella tarda]